MNKLYFLWFAVGVVLAAALASTGGYYFGYAIGVKYAEERSRDTANQKQSEYRQQIVELQNQASKLNYEKESLQKDLADLASLSRRKKWDNGGIYLNNNYGYSVYVYPGWSSEENERATQVGFWPSALEPSGGWTMDINIATSTVAEFISSLESTGQNVISREEKIINNNSATYLKIKLDRNQSGLDYYLFEKSGLLYVIMGNGTSPLDPAADPNNPNGDYVLYHEREAFGRLVSSFKLID